MSRSDMALDYNHRPSLSDCICEAIDGALVARNEATPAREYLGGSRLGVECERALQFEWMQTPKDEGRGFNGQTLRIFAMGHSLENMAAEWLRAGGFTLWTEKPNGHQFGFSAAQGRLRGHVDGVITKAPPGTIDASEDRPALWECKTMNAKHWRDCAKRGVAVSKPVYAAQIATYQAYMAATIPGIADAPALFTAINKDTAELHFEAVPFDAGLAQRASDKAVRIFQATEAGETLPRIAASSDHFACKWCDWFDTCWRG